MELILLGNLGKTDRASVSVGYKVQRALAQATAVTVITKRVSLWNAAVECALQPVYTDLVWRLCFQQSHSFGT